MKKIIALMLVICCLLSFAACKKNNNKTDEPTPENNQPANPDDNNTPKPDELTAEELAAIAAIQAKVDASVPETATIDVLLKAALDDLRAEYTVTYNTDGTASVVYSYETFNTVGDAFADDYKTTHEGSAMINADGAVVGSLGEVSYVEGVAFEIALEATKLANVTVNSNTLSATVKAADTKAVLGVELAYDVKIVVSVSTLGVASVAISYESAAGAVEIVATYTYYVAPEEDGEGEDITE